MAVLEVLTLDGLVLNDTTFILLALSCPPPSERQEWVGAADSEFEVLTRKPLHNNREITARIQIAKQSTMDLALDKIGLVVDKLAKASKSADGIALTWTPATSTRTVTFDVLSGEITDLPTDFETGWLSLSPTITITMKAKPYWRGTETQTSPSGTVTPLQTQEVTNSIGDVPALGRLVVTDTASQTRRHVEWGLEGPATYNSALSLMIDSDNMVTSGFGGTQVVTTGAYDPNATGNNSISVTARTLPTSLAGTGTLAHVGTFRVKARIWSSALSQARFTWRAGDGPPNVNNWGNHGGSSQWREVDLGSITIPAALSGSQLWSGQVDVQTIDSTATMAIDYLILMPASDGYGKARGRQAQATGTISAIDTFAGMAGGAALSARTPDVGAAWVTAGGATDFTQVTNGGDSMVQRTDAAATRRYGVLGSAMTDQTIFANIYFPIWNTFGTASLIARYVDTANHLRLDVDRPTAFPGVATVSLVKVVAGVATTLAGTGGMSQAGAIGMYLTVYASGQISATVTLQASVTLTAQDAVLATAGALASGKGGIADLGSATNSNKLYDNVTVTTPVSEAVVLYSGRTMEVRHNDVIRIDSGNTYYGKVPAYNGSRFLVPVGTSRVAVKARRNDIDSGYDDNVIDNTQIYVAVTPRGLAVPR